MSYSYLMKFIIVGDSGVGKSSLLNQFINRVFISVHELTIGVEFAAKIVRIKDKNNDLHNVKIQIWDTAGQETFRSITQSYYKGAAVALLVFDITKKHTFENMKEWYNDIMNKCSDDVSIVIIGNKNDLKDKRQVEEKEVTNFIKYIKKNIPYYETTAKEHEVIDDIFNNQAVNLINKIMIDNELPEGVKSINCPVVNLKTRQELLKKNNQCCTIL